MHHPDVEISERAASPKARATTTPSAAWSPSTPTWKGFRPRTFRRIEKRAVDEYARFVGDALPESLRRRRRLLTLPEALREAHFPDRFAGELARGVPSGEPRRRLAFEELFLVQLGLALRRRGVKVEPGIAFRALPETRRPRRR